MNLGRIIFSAAFVVAAPALSTISYAAPAIETIELAASDQWHGVILSPVGGHAAVLAMKGSRFVVIIDGVSGPKLDGLLTLNGQQFLTGNASPGNFQSIPVLFSDNGEHSAYFGRVADEYILVRDGQEIVRGKYTPSGLTYSTLAFTAGGRHLYYSEIDPGVGYRIIMDGEPGPTSSVPPQVVTSPDGEHYAYSGSTNDTNRTRWGVIDGKKVEYFGDNLQYTAKGGLLSITRNGGTNTSTLYLNGKPLVSGSSVEPVWTAPKGGMVAAFLKKDFYDATGVLTINGKPVPATEGTTVLSVYFSPDGQRYAAICRTPANVSVAVIDGKRGYDYQMISEMQAPFPQAFFTADSSKFIYVAVQGGQYFLVEEGEEWDGYPDMIYPVVGGGGKRIGFISNDGKAQRVVVDGEARTYTGADALNFSADGNHYAFVAGYPNTRLYIDGVERPGGIVGRFTLTHGSASLDHNTQYLFSPDGRHTLYLGRSIERPEDERGAFIDGVLAVRGVNDIRQPLFTPDSRHVVWISTRRPSSLEETDTSVVYVDGEAVMNYAAFSTLDTLKGNWQMSNDGVFSFIAVEKGRLKRFRITPSDDTSVEALLSKAGARKEEADGKQAEEVAQ